MLKGLAEEHFKCSLAVEVNKRGAKCFSIRCPFKII